MPIGHSGICRKTADECLRVGAGRRRRSLACTPWLSTSSLERSRSNHTAADQACSDLTRMPRWLRTMYFIYSNCERLEPPIQSYNCAPLTSSIAFATSRFTVHAALPLASYSRSLLPPRQYLTKTRSASGTAFGLGGISAVLSVGRKFNVPRSRRPPSVPAFVHDRAEGGPQRRMHGGNLRQGDRAESQQKEHNQEIEWMPVEFGSSTVFR